MIRQKKSKNPLKFYVLIFLDSNLLILITVLSGQLADHRSAATEEPFELSELITSAVPQATKNKVQWAYRVFHSWAS